MKHPTSKRTPRPRNHLARHQLLKKGGEHKKSEKAERKAAKQSLKNDYLDEFLGENELCNRVIFAKEFQTDLSRVF